VSLDTVRDGELAAVVTYLEMRERPEVRVPPSPLRLEKLAADPDAYRALFRAVGARWLWFSRLIMDDAALLAIIGDPAVEVIAVEDGSQQVGLLELDFRVAGECELAFVGLVPGLAGLGHGRWLLAEALRLAWRSGVRRVHVHTCTLDHPAALAAYLRAGFTAYTRSVETFADPRLLGVLPLDCAPQLPVLGTLATG
jgi:GNAT superfamily N-acetyltransferase